MYVFIFSVSNTEYPIQCSIKLCRRTSQLFSHGGSFDHLDLQSLNDYKMFFFHFANVSFISYETCNTPLERYFQEFEAPKFQNFELVDQKNQNLYSNSWVLDVPHCLMKHVGASLRGRAWKKWFVSWTMIWSRHIEGVLFFKIHYII